VSGCNHRDRAGYSLVEFFLVNGAEWRASDRLSRLARALCPRCGDVGIGRPVEPTDPEIRRVHAIERRAAEIAHGSPMKIGEAWGWDDWDADETPVDDYEWAGWLARAITEHKETP